MQKEEISYGLKQAVEKGESLEKAKKSFINAGYSQQDVEDSAKALDGVLSLMPEENQALELSETNLNPQEHKSSTLKVLIIVLAVILLALVGFLISIFFFKNKLPEFLSKIFS